VLRAQANKVEINLGKQIAAAIVASTVFVAPVFAADLENGAQVFAGNCAACHAGGNNVIQPEKTLRKEALEQYLEGGLKETSIVYQVTNGKNAMPAFGGRLDESDIKDVAAYVFDQSTNAKWD
jgi:cytochrome c6